MPSNRTLSASDCTEIYYALEYKLTSPAVVDDKRWIAQLNSIIEKIGVDGDTLAAQSKTLAKRKNSVFSVSEHEPDHDESPYVVLALYADRAEAEKFITEKEADRDAAPKDFADDQLTSDELWWEITETEVR